MKAVHGDPLHKKWTNFRPKNWQSPYVHTGHTLIKWEIIKAIWNKFCRPTATQRTSNQRKKIDTDHLAKNEIRHIDGIGWGQSKNRLATRGKTLNIVQRGHETRHISTPIYIEFVHLSATRRACLSNIQQIEIRGVLTKKWPNIWLFTLKRNCF